MLENNNVNKSKKAYRVCFFTLLLVIIMIQLIGRYLMENNEKFIKADKLLELSVNHSYLIREIDQFRGKLNEVEFIKLYLEAGVSPILLQERLCEYFWTTVFKLHYHSEVLFKEAQEFARVAPSDFGLVSVEYLKSRRTFWQNECYSIEKALLSTCVSKSQFLDEEIEELSKKIFKNMQLQDKKIIARCKALDRYDKLSRLNQLKENIKRKNPKKINFDSMSIEEIENLYSGKKK